jgi:hypothetical protein
MTNEESFTPRYELMTPEEVALVCEGLVNPLMDKLEPIRTQIAASMSWEERAEEIIANTQGWTQEFIARNHSLEDARLFRCVLMAEIACLQRLYSGSYYEPKPTEDSYRENMSRVASGFKALARAVQHRREEHSAQLKYTEVRLSAQRALDERRGPDLLEDFPKLIEFVKEGCSSHVHEYTERDVLLKVDEFFDAIHMIAHDGATAAEIPNPPARIRTALARQRRRSKLLERERKAELPEDQSLDEILQDDADLEADTMVNVDLERAIVGLGLTADQEQIVRTQAEGLRLQESGAAEFLGWDAKRLESVRRSLCPDRPTGKRLREHLAIYRQTDKKNLDRLS